MRGVPASRAASGGEHGGAAQTNTRFFEHRAAGRVADYPRIGSETVWPSGLRRWLKAPVRRGARSSPTAVIARAQMPERPLCRRRRRAISECACPRRPARATRPRGLEASRHRDDESAARPQNRPPWGSDPRPRGRGPCALLTELGGSLAILDVVIIIHDSQIATGGGGYGRGGQRIAGPAPGASVAADDTARPSGRGLPMLCLRLTPHHALGPVAPQARAGLSRIVGTFGNRAASFRKVGMPTSGRPQFRRATRCTSRAMSSPGVEPGLSRPQRDVLTTRR
jgi:hypothetical protein